MSLAFEIFDQEPRLKALLEHLSVIADPRDTRRVGYRLDEVLLLVVCGTMAECDDYDAIAAWGKAHVHVLRRYLPYEFGTPGGRWLTILMNRINPALFSASFTNWVRAAWPDKLDFVAIDGKTSRRSHDRAEGKAPLHLVTAFATTQRLVLGQEPVADKSNEIEAIPELVARLGENGGLEGALVSIDAIATNPTIATAIRDVGADYLLAVKENQPTLRAELEAFFRDRRPDKGDVHEDVDKGHGRIEQRVVTVAREVDWLGGDRRYPGELRLPAIATIIKVRSRAETRQNGREDTRYYISSAMLTAQRAGHAVRGHWGIENRLHWVLDVVFREDQSRLRKGHGAKNMAIVRHFALNLIRTAKDRNSLKLRRKLAGWDPNYLVSLIEGTAS